MSAHPESARPDVSLLPAAHLLSQYWWLLLLRGILAILFGVAAYAWPGKTLVTLFMLFAAYAFVDGICDVIHAVSNRKRLDQWWLLLLEGLFGIAFGVLAFRAPLVATVIGEVVLAMFIAAWAIVTGAMRIALAIRLRKEIEGEWLLGATGVIAILLGLVIMARPAVGVLAVLWVVAAWAIVMGIVLIVLAFRSRKLPGKLGELADRKPV